LPFETSTGGATIRLHTSGRPAMWEMIIWPTEQFSVSSCTTTSRPVLRTDSSIISWSHGTIERRSISSTLTAPATAATASRDFSIVLPTRPA